MDADTEKWITEVLKAVFKKVELPMEGAVIQDVKEKKKKLLVLAKSEQSFTEAKQLNQYYDLDCVAIHNQLSCDLSHYEAVILRELDNACLSKLAVGMADEPYVKIAAEAILSGKTIYVLAEGIEFCRYKKTAPAEYYKVFETHLDMLKKSGVTVCANAELVSNLLQGGKKSGTHLNESGFSEVPEETKCISKKVITEKDLMELKREHHSLLQVEKRCIITDLAKEFAQKHNIFIHQM